MDRLPHDPRNFREMVEADLRRGARLIIKVQDEIDPQFRVATPKGDWAIAVTLPNDEQGRSTIWRALSTFMIWKQALAFTLTTELYDPDSVWCAGVSPNERHVCLSRIRREPRPWTKENFGTIDWMPESSIDPAIIDLLPKGPRVLTPKEVGDMVTWFGREGKFPAVNLTTGEIGA